MIWGWYVDLFVLSNLLGLIVFLILVAFARVEEEAL